tara:strand:+ start:641 stop:856 length:216 start_codon:yes stop_codon:yes gene_type:complete
MKNITIPLDSQTTQSFFPPIVPKRKKEKKEKEKKEKKVRWKQGKGRRGGVHCTPTIDCPAACAVFAAFLIF